MKVINRFINSIYTGSNFSEVIVQFDEVLNEHERIYTKDGRIECVVTGETVITTQNRETATSKSEIYNRIRLVTNKPLDFIPTRYLAKGANWKKV